VDRAELLYVLSVLHDKKELLEKIGPATDQPKLARRQIEALCKAAEDLMRPRFSINPFV
jgi:hypothetical protein